MSGDDFEPVTPGEILKEEFLKGYALSQNQLARAIGISPNRIAEIVNNRRRITADTALRLALYFGRLRPLRGDRNSARDGAPLCSGAALCELLPALVQAG